MNIRTITFFTNVGFPLVASALDQAGAVSAELKEALTRAGYTVQTVRLATPPCAETVGGDASHTLDFAQALEVACAQHNIQYASIGPARPGDAAEFFSAIPAVLGATQTIFASAIIANSNQIDLRAIRQAARVIHHCSTITPDGFGNLRFAALANVPAGVPFLPAAYHRGGAPVVALGLECADLAVSACTESKSLEAAREGLIARIEQEAQTMQAIIEPICQRRQVQFGGFDFSLAQYPTPSRSIGTALEAITGQPIGAAGTVAAAALLTEALQRARYPHVGFSGLFLPVLEDSILAQRAAEGTFTVNDLLLYSAVCGTGLDTIPLPGHVTEEALATVLLDVATLAVRLNKPLTARLMPIPGKQAGEAVTFDFEFFAPSRVMGVEASRLAGLFQTTESFVLNAR